MSSSGRTVLLQVGNIAAFIVTLIVNGLSNTTIIGGRTTAQVSDAYPTLITPAGYVFAIWGIIYTLLALFVIFQALPSQRSRRYQNQVSALFILSCTFNVIWLFTWQYNYVAASVIPMFALLGTLAAIYLRLGVGKIEAPRKEKAFVRLPFSVYVGWITVAAFADVAAALSAAGWVKWALEDVVWGIAAAVLLLAIALSVVLSRRDAAYGLVIVWALVGIAVKQTPVLGIVYTAEIGAIIIAAAVVAALWLSRRKIIKKP